MSRLNMEGDRLANFVLERGLQLQPQEWVPASGDAIDINMPPFLLMNPAGAVNIKMPTSNPLRKGIMFLVVNESGSTITFQTDGGAGFTTAITVATTKAAILICTGSATQALGWRQLAGA